MFARDQLIMLIFLPILLCIWCTAHKIYLLCSRIRIALSLFSLSMLKICVNKSLLIADNLERLFYYGVFINGSKIHRVLSDNDYLIRVHISHLLQFFKNVSYYASIMFNAFSDLLCWNYAGIIGWSLMSAYCAYNVRNIDISHISEYLLHIK